MSGFDEYSSQRADDMLEEIKADLAAQRERASKTSTLFIAFDSNGILIPAAQHSASQAERKKLLKEEIRHMEDRLYILREALELLTAGRPPSKLPRNKKALWKTLSKEHGGLMRSLNLAKKLMLSWVNRV